MWQNIANAFTDIWVQREFGKTSTTEQNYRFRRASDICYSLLINADDMSSTCHSRMLS